MPQVTISWDPPSDSNIIEEYHIYRYKREGRLGRNPDWCSIIKDNGTRIVLDKPPGGVLPTEHIDTVDEAGTYYYLVFSSNVDGELSECDPDSKIEITVAEQIALKISGNKNEMSVPAADAIEETQTNTTIWTILLDVSQTINLNSYIVAEPGFSLQSFLHNNRVLTKFERDNFKLPDSPTDKVGTVFVTLEESFKEVQVALDTSDPTTAEAVNENTITYTIIEKEGATKEIIYPDVFYNSSCFEVSEWVTPAGFNQPEFDKNAEIPQILFDDDYKGRDKIKLRLKKKTFSITFQVDPTEALMSLDISPEERDGKINLDLNMLENDTSTGSTPWQGEKQFTKTGLDSSGAKPQTPFTCDNNFELNMASSDINYGFDVHSEFETEGLLTIDTRKSNLSSGKVVFSIQSDVIIKIKYTKYFYLTIYVQDPNLLGLAYYANDGSQLNLYKYFNSLVQLPEGFIEGSEDRIDREEFHETYPSLSIITHYNWDQVQHSILEDRDEGWHKNDNRMIFRSPLAYRFKLNTKNKIVTISPEYIDKTRNSNRDLFETSFEPQDLCDIHPLPGIENTTIIDLGEGKQQITVNEEDTVLMLSHKRFWKSTMQLYLSEENCIGGDCGKYISSEDFDDFSLSYTLPVRQNAVDPESNLISFEVNEAYEFDKWEVDTKMVYFQNLDPLASVPAWHASGLLSNVSLKGDRIARPIISKKCGEFSFDDVYFDHYLIAHSLWHIAAREGDTLVLKKSSFGEVFSSKFVPQVWSIAKDTDILKEKKSLAINTGTDNEREEWLVTQPKSDEYFVVINISDDDTIGSRLKRTTGVGVGSRNPISGEDRLSINTYSHIDVYTQNELISNSSSYQAILYDEIPRTVIAHIKLKTFTIKILSSHPGRGSVDASVITKGASNDFVDLLDDDGNVIGKVLENATAEYIFNIEALRTTGTSIFTNWSIRNEDDVSNFVNFDDNENNWEPLKSNNKNLKSYFEIEIVANFTPLYGLITYFDYMISQSTADYLYSNIFLYNGEEETPKIPYFRQRLQGTMPRESVREYASLLNVYLPNDETSAFRHERDTKNWNLSISSIENYIVELFGYPEFSLLGNSETNFKLILDDDILQISNYRFLHFTGHGKPGFSVTDGSRIDAVEQFKGQGYEILTPEEISSPGNVYSSKITMTKDSINIAQFMDIFLLTDKSNQDRGSIVLEAIEEQEDNFFASEKIDNSYWISLNDVSSVISYDPSRREAFSSRDIDKYKEEPFSLTPAGDSLYLKYSFAAVKIKAQTKPGWALNRWQIIKGSSFIYNFEEVEEKDNEEEFVLILAHDTNLGKESHHALEIRGEFVKLSTLTIIIEEDFMGYAEGAGIYKETDKITVRAFRNMGVRLDGTEYILYEVVGYEEVLERGQESGIKFRDTLDDIFANPKGRDPAFFIKSDVTLKIKFEYTKYLFATKLTTIEEWQGGTIDLATTEDGLYEPIDDIYVKAVPDEGFVFYEWKILSGVIPDGFDVKSQEQTFKLQGSLEIEARFATVNTVSVLIGDGKADFPADQAYINDDTIAYIEQGALDPSFHTDFSYGNADYNNYEDYVSFEKVNTKTYNGPQDIFIKVTLVNTDLYQLGEWLISPASRVHLIHGDGSGRNSGTSNLRTFNSKYINKRPLFFECNKNAIVTIYLERANILTITMDDGIESVETRKIDLLNSNGEFKYYSNTAGAVNPYTKYDDFNVVSQAWVDYELFWLNAKLKEGYSINGIEVLSGELAYPTRIGPFLLSDGTIHYVDNGDTGAEEKAQLAMMPYLETFATGNDAGKIGVMQALIDVFSFLGSPNTQYLPAISRVSLFGQYLSRVSLLQTDGGKDDGATPAEREAYGLDTTSSYFPNSIVTTSWFIRKDTSIHVTSKLKESSLSIVFVGVGFDLEQEHSLDSILEITKEESHSIYNGYNKINYTTPSQTASISRTRAYLNDPALQELGNNYTKEDEITLSTQDLVVIDVSFSHGSPTHLHSVKSRFKRWKILTGSTVEEIDSNSPNITFKIKEDTVIIAQFERCFEIEVENKASFSGIEVKGDKSYGELDFIKRELTQADYKKKWWEIFDTWGKVESENSYATLSASEEDSSGRVFGGWTFVESGEVSTDPLVAQDSDDGEVNQYIAQKQKQNELVFSTGDQDYIIRNLFFSKKIKLSINYVTAYSIQVNWEIYDTSLPTESSVESPDLNSFFDYMLDDGQTVEGYNNESIPVVIYTDSTSNGSLKLIAQENEEFKIQVAKHPGLIPYEFIEWTTNQGSFTNSNIDSNDSKNKTITCKATKSEVITARLRVSRPAILVWPVMEYPLIKNLTTDVNGDYKTINQSVYSSDFWKNDMSIYNDIDFLLPGGNLTYLNLFSPVAAYTAKEVNTPRGTGRTSILSASKDSILHSSKISGLVPDRWEADNVEYLTRIQFVPELWNKIYEQIDGFKDTEGFDYIQREITKNTLGKTNSKSMRPDYFIQGYNKKGALYGKDMMPEGIVSSSTKRAGYPGLNISEYSYNPGLATLKSGIKINFNSECTSSNDCGHDVYNLKSLEFNKNNITQGSAYGFVENGIAFLKYKRKKYSLIVRTNQSIMAKIGVYDNQGNLSEIQEDEQWSDQISFMASPPDSNDLNAIEWQKTVDPSHGTSTLGKFYILKQPGQRGIISYRGITKETLLLNFENEIDNYDELPSDPDILDRVFSASTSINPGLGNNLIIRENGSEYEAFAEIGKDLDSGITDYDFFIVDVAFQLSKQSIEPDNGYDPGDNVGPDDKSFEESNGSLYSSVGCSGWPTFFFKEINIHGRALSENIQVDGKDLSTYLKEDTRGGWGNYIVGNKGLKYSFLKSIISPCDKEREGADSLFYNSLSGNPFNKRIIGLFGGRPLFNYYGNRIISSGASYTVGWVQKYETIGKTTKINNDYVSSIQYPFKYFRGNRSVKTEKYREFPWLYLLVYHMHDSDVSRSHTINSTIKTAWDSKYSKHRLDWWKIGSDKLELKRFVLDDNEEYLSAYVDSITGERPQVPASSYIYGPNWKDLSSGKSMSSANMGKNATDLAILKGSIHAPSENSATKGVIRKNRRTGSGAGNVSDSDSGVKYYGSNASGKFKGHNMSVKYGVMDIGWLRDVDPSPYVDLRNTRAQALGLKSKYGTTMKGGAARMWPAGNSSTKKVNPPPDVNAPEYEFNYPLYLPFYLAIDADGWNFKWFDLPDEPSRDIKTGAGTTRTLALEGGYLPPGVKNSNSMKNVTSSYANGGFKWSYTCNKLESRLNNDYYRGYYRNDGQVDHLFPGYDVSMSRWMYATHRFKWNGALFSTWDAQGYEGVFSGKPVTKDGETFYGSRSWATYPSNWDKSVNTFSPLYGHTDIIDASSEWYTAKVDIDGNEKIVPFKIQASPFMTGPRNGLLLSNSRLKFPSFYADSEARNTIVYAPDLYRRPNTNPTGDVEYSPFTDVSYGGGYTSPSPFFWDYGRTPDSAKTRSSSSDVVDMLFSKHLQANIFNIETITGLDIDQIKTLLPLNHDKKDFGLSINHKEILTSYTMNLFRDKLTKKINPSFAPYSYTHPYAGIQNKDLLVEFDLPKYGGPYIFWPSYLDHVPTDLSTAERFTVYSDDFMGKLPGGEFSTTTKPSLTRYTSMSTKAGLHGTLDDRISYAARKYEVLMIRSSSMLAVFIRIPFSKSKYPNTNGWIYCCSREVGNAEKDSEIFMEHGAGGTTHWGTNEVTNNGRDNLVFTKPGTAPMDAAVYYDNDNLTPILRIAYRTVENKSFIGHSVDYSPKLGEVLKDRNNKEYTVVEKDYSYYDESALKDRSKMVLSSRWYKVRSNERTGSSHLADHNLREAGITSSDLFDHHSEYIVTHIEGHEENRDVVVLEDIRLPKTVSRRYENTGLRSPEKNYRTENEALVESFNKDEQRTNMTPNPIEYLYDLTYPIWAFGRHISLSGDGESVAISADQRKYYMVRHDAGMNDGSFMRDWLMLDSYGNPSLHFEKNNSYKTYHWLNVNQDNFPVALAEGINTIGLENQLDLNIGDTGYVGGTRKGNSWPGCLAAEKGTTYACLEPSEGLPTGLDTVENIGKEFNKVYGRFWRWRNIHQRFLTYKLK